MSGTDKKHIRTSFSYVLGSQLIIMAIGIIRALVLPAFFSVPAYGYWEIYLFYTAYVGLFCIGFNDGVYLRYGKYDYGDLPFRILRPANRIYVLQLAAFTVIALIAVTLFTKDTDERYAMGFACLNILVMGIYGLIIHILQITDQFKKYSIFSIVDKVVVLVAIGLMFIASNDNFRIIIAVDFATKVGVLGFMIYVCREIMFGRDNTRYRTAMGEYGRNVSVGIKLMVANLMSMLLVGAGRLIVQIWGDIEDFAVYSFGITVTGLVLTAITAFSLVLYPVLKRLPEENYGSYFGNINVMTRTFGFLSMFAFYPAFWLITIAYAKYSDVLLYLNLLFGVVYLQSKISILNNTFYKVLREEKSMLKANLSCVLIFVALAAVGFILKDEIWVIALCTFLAMALRCYTSEVFLSGKLSAGNHKGMIQELGMLLLFILTTSFLDIFISLIINAIAFTLYFFVGRKEITSTIKALRN